MKEITIEEFVLLAKEMLDKYQEYTKKNEQREQQVFEMYPGDWWDSFDMWADDDT